MTTARLTDRKRDAIVQAAILAFRQYGFEATSMDRIAADAGVSKRTVYNHFPSKEELFADILLALWERSLAKLDLPYQPDVPLREQLLALLEQKRQMLNDPQFIDLARVAIAATMHAPERAGAMVQRLAEREEGLTLWIRAASADSRLKPLDPVFASHQLQSLLKGLLFWPQIALGEAMPAPEMQARVVESAVDMFLAYYAQPA